MIRRQRLSTPAGGGPDTYSEDESSYKLKLSEEGNITARKSITHYKNDTSPSPKRLSFSILQWIRHIIRARGRLQASLLFTSITFIGVILILLVLLQMDAFIREYQGPLDHVTTSFLTPYYSLSCPVFSSSDDDVQTSTTKPNEKISWDCNIEQNRENNIVYYPSFPRIFMIGARDKDEDTFHAWKQNISQSKHQQPYIERINTLKISNQYALSGGKLRNSISNLNSTIEVTKQKQYLCRKMKWEHRLVFVYQTVFASLLETYPNDTGFVIIEDDAILISPHFFAKEVCGAHRLQLGFYSLYRSPLQKKGKSSSISSCMYKHGTVAFYIQRSIMEKIVNEQRRSQFCRFPIDMYISKLGPWYSTRRDIVGHADTVGRVGSL